MILKVGSTDRLREIDVYSVVVYQHSLHLEISSLTVLLILELDKCILEAILGSFVSNDFARDYFTESTEDEI